MIKVWRQQLHFWDESNQENNAAKDLSFDKSDVLASKLSEDSDSEG